MPLLKVSELWIYPVKSLGGIRVEKASILPKGFSNDRRWMLVDENNQFMTQRTLPPMARFHLSVSNGGFLVTHGDEQQVLPAVASGEDMEAAIWDDRVLVKAVDPGMDAWFSRLLDKPCRLVAFPEERARPVDPRFVVGDDHVSLADAYPMLLIGQSSLDDLNSRLDQPVPMNRFRPNIVVTGGQPFEEDGWKRFQIGKSRFAGVKPCARCILTTIDQETIVKSSEPLATLSKYRKVGNKVLFGQNLIPLTDGVINVGDELTVEEWSDT